MHFSDRVKYETLGGHFLHFYSPFTFIWKEQRGKLCSFDIYLEARNWCCISSLWMLPQEKRNHEELSVGFVFCSAKHLPMESVCFCLCVNNIILSHFCGASLVEFAECYEWYPWPSLFTMQTLAMESHKSI